MIAIVDFGSQTTHLIGRRLAEFSQTVEMIPPAKALDFIRRRRPRGLILSGGPASVYESGAPTVSVDLFNLQIPILGICYGFQLTAHLLGGAVRQGQKKEFGGAVLTIDRRSDLFFSKNKSLPSSFAVWMSHGDEVIKLPTGFDLIGQTKTTKYAAAACAERKIYGLQFHPEVIHTQFGREILANFVKICGLSVKLRQIDTDFITCLTADIKDALGPAPAICALSGGVDSSVAAVLTHRAIGHQLTSLYIDSGLMRQGETQALRQIFKKHFQMKVKVVQARKIFLKNLKSVVKPEAKRRIIGRTFIKILEKEARKLGARFLVQGTIYPDVIESAGAPHAQKIKTHHNVGGLPKRMKLTLVEPLRNLYKDEVRQIGKIIGLSDEIIHRQPFPGPGLAIRIIGALTEKKLRLVRAADAIIQEEIKKAKLSQKLWQAFAVYAGVKTTGVRGDRRAYGETVAVRCLEATDAMTAHWSRLSYGLLETISTRIVNEIPEVNRVVYDITNKPPGTMEWE